MKMSMAEIKRNNLIDFLKGLLIILVIIGHVLPGELSNNPVRYIIYSFHMPAFFYVSGVVYSGKRKLKDYAIRLGIPWLFAIQIYFFLLNYNSLSIISYVKAYIFPYYHLWFVCGFLFCIIIAKVCRENIKLLICIGLVFSIISIMLNGNEFIIWKFVEHTIRPQYLLFFSLGILSRNKLSHTKFTLVFSVLFVLFLPLGYFYQSYWWEQIVRYILLSGVFYSINLWKHNISLNKLCLIGKLTYPIYLWHVLGIVIITFLTNSNYGLIYYLGVLVYVLALIAVLFFIRNNKISIFVGR